METLPKLFSPSRFSGKCFYAYRHFKNVPSKIGGNTLSVYNGRSAVVVTEATSFCLDYNMLKQKAVFYFHVQRYTAEGLATDSTLQAKMNQ